MKEFRVAELRADEQENNELILESVPILYDTPTTINAPFGEYKEVIQRGALDNTDLSDVSLYINHDVKKIPLARTPKTMHLRVGSAGLQMKAELPNTEEGRSVHTAVERGDLKGMSFAFTVDDDGSHYDAKTNTRTITKINKVYECSVVSFPAYPQTSVEARSQIEEVWNELNSTARQQTKIKINQLLKREF